MAEYMSSIRIHLVYIAIIAVLAAGYYLTKPRNFTECREEAARNAKSKEAMFVLIDVCRAKFPQIAQVRVEQPAKASKPDLVQPAPASRAEQLLPLDPTLDFSAYGVPVDEALPAAPAPRKAKASK